MISSFERDNTWSFSSRRFSLCVRVSRATINAIAPGFIRTAMTDAMTDEARTTLEARIALHRLGTPDDVAYAVAFLASEQAGYITARC
jgi:NAD(P)-dependent dehydrogenase (short-subunit alcohol dehydrogenase family)